MFDSRIENILIAGCCLFHHLLILKKRQQQETILIIMNQMTRFIYIVVHSEQHRNQVLDDTEYWNLNT